MFELQPVLCPCPMLCQALFASSDKPAIKFGPSWSPSGSGVKLALWHKALLQEGEVNIQEMRGSLPIPCPKAWPRM